MLVPFFMYNFVMVLFGFALLGIGNTIVQVSANPLLVDVVPGNRASSFLSFSQFIKAIGSMIAPPLAAMFAARLGDWKLLFLAFGIVSLLSVLWLGFIKVEESKETEERASFNSAIKLLGNRFVLLMVLSIFVVVGIDVGFNSNSGQFLINSFGMEQNAAESGRSFYFFGRMVGTFFGALLLTRFSSGKFFLWSTILGIVSIFLILIFPSLSDNWSIWIIDAMIVIIGLAVANIFPLVFSITVDKFPGRSNEISGLMMMAISGGAVFPPLMGWITNISNNVFGMAVLLVCMIYLFFVASWVLNKQN
ncbi:MAG: MFS transporter, partial [Bacteroidales bacterium]|nr:MFS transporter [Bacteroidales bacterium]